MNELAASRTKIDRVGAFLARGTYRSDDEYFELDELFDEYRKAIYSLYLKPRWSYSLGWVTTGNRTILPNG
jgi:hypothetical protein